MNTETSGSRTTTEYPLFSVENNVAERLEHMDKQYFDNKDFYVNKELRVLAKSSSLVKVAEGSEIELKIELLVPLVIEAR